MFMAELTPPLKKILIVDDEQPIRESLRLLLKSNFAVSLAEDGESAVAIFEDVAPDLVLLDVMMPKLDGLETLKKLREKNANVPVIMLTGANTVRTAVQAMKAGALDYLNKPFDIEELTSLMIATLGDEVLEKPGTQSVSIVEIEADFGPLVGRSTTMADLFSKVGQVAIRNSTVLITGESGTGKELIAKQIHKLSTRKNGPFVALNCAAIPETLIESEIFGHEKGAFTHAIERRLGHFELADGGTLFLDEIGELSLTVQVKMLRFLQEQEFYRIGRPKPIKVDVRIIAATNRNLEELIQEKKFRQDLFYRINVINVAIPPLRDRFEDIPNLAMHFVKKFAGRYGGKQLSFAKDALDILVQYDWPGNVRELENVMESLMALVPHDVICEDDLPRKLKNRASMQSFKGGVIDGDIKFDDAEKLFETEMILKALRKTNFVQTRAAELLGISRRILKYKMDKLGISESGEVASPPANN